MRTALLYVGCAWRVRYVYENVGDDTYIDHDDVKNKPNVLGMENDMYIEDENAFVFSINNNKIYNILVPQKAIRFYDINLIKAYHHLTWPLFLLDRN